MKKITLLGAVASLLLGTTIHAQVTAVGNATVPPYRFVGWDGTGPGGAKDLDIRNDWNRPINMFTNGINRSRLNGTFTTLLNGVNQNVSGFMGLAPDGYFANNTPITLLY